MSDAAAGAEAPKKTTLTVTIDGKSMEANPGELLIAAAERAGTFIPRFCWHPRMREVGMCRMCLVEIDGPRGPALQPACMAPVAEGMVVNTQSPTVKKAQDGVLEFLLINHPLDCPVCDKGGECPLQDQTLTFGPGETRFVEEKRHYEKPIAISDLVNLDRERCILCDRCTRFSKEVSGDPLIHFINRGNATEVNTFPDDPYASYFSGNVVQICPVGALTAKPYRFAARPWDLDQVESTCTTCAVGCRVVVQSSGDRIIRKQGVDSDPVNWGWLCDKGRFDYEAIHAPNRFTHPLVRATKGADATPAAWPDALSAAADALRAAGPARVGVIGGARLSNEDQYAWAKLAKGVIGTDNVDAQLGDGLPADLWLGLPQATIDDACAASAVLLLGPDLKEELPVLFIRLRDAAVNRGVPLFEVSPTATGMSSVARASVHYRPGEVALVLRALLNAASGTKIAEHIVGGVDADTLNSAGEALGAALTSGRGNGRLVVVLGRANLAESPDAVIEAASLLASGVADVSFLPAMRRANLHGALDMGLSPGLLPGRVRLADGASWLNAQGWPRMPLQTGLDTTAMLQAAAAGEITTLVLLGADPLADHPDHELARRALTRVDTLIAVDTLPTASNALATVILPAAGYGEKAGTTTNIEGRVTTLATKTSAPGVARPDWMIAAELALHLDTDFGVENVWHLTDEIARVAPTHARLSPAALAAAGNGIVAGAPAAADDAGADADGAAAADADADGAAAAGAGAPAPAGSDDGSVEDGVANEATDPNRAQSAGPGRPPVLSFPISTPVEAVAVPLPDSYSLRLVLARRLYDAGTLVQASTALGKLAPGAALHLHPGEIERHGLRDGGMVRVTAANGTALVIRAEADERVPRGTALFPFNQPGDVHAGQLIDAASTEAATKVRLESVGGDGMIHAFGLLAAETGDPLFERGIELFSTTMLLVIIKALVVFVVLLVSVMFMVWFERKVISDMQDRIGPNRAGPWGLLQTLADGTKLFFKETLFPDKADKWVFRLAPYLSAVPAFLAFSIVPIGGSFELFGHRTNLQLADPPMGVLFTLAISGIAVYGVMLAGWSSGSKYPLLGSVRASAQMVSYEAAMGLTIATVVLVSKSLRTGDIVANQAGYRWHLWILGFVPAIIFAIAGTAELNRPPFDLVEAESELVGGFHTEYSSARFAFFFLAEFMNTITMSAIIVTLFLGGPTIPWDVPILTEISPIWFVLKLLVLLFTYVWLRATLPRFRYDQLMDLGWKKLIPAALFWLLIIAAIQIERWYLAIAGPAALLAGGILILAMKRGRERTEEEHAEAAALSTTSGRPGRF